MVILSRKVGSHPIRKVVERFKGRHIVYVGASRERRIGKPLRD